MSILKLYRQIVCWLENRLQDTSSSKPTSFSLSEVSIKSMGVQTNCWTFSGHLKIGICTLLSHTIFNIWNKLIDDHDLLCSYVKWMLCLLVSKRLQYIISVYLICFTTDRTGAFCKMCFTYRIITENFC